ncbi:DUF551 domain-containing protein [Herbaspirillum sp. ST 5-3]|uniref:DUF551 domain-containing protein n=1 Tax=Oxalobacteraceae TaxID=75682 RepID=UPI0010A3DD9C|nr:DUF551 domain-containing protein [Herbaspirillum sp. ST 5-3]
MTDTKLEPELPKLPKQDITFADHSYPAFSAKAMQSYALAALSQAAQPGPELAKDCTIETFDTTTVDGYIRHLTWAVWRDHYAETSPDFGLLPDTIGALTQLDNMLTGWTLEKDDAIRALAAIAADRNKRAPVGSLTDDDLLRIADGQVLGVFDDATGEFRVYLQPGTDIAHVVIAFARALLSSVAPRVPEWISVKDRLPDLHQAVALVDVERWRNTGADFEINHHAVGYLSWSGYSRYWSCFGESRGQVLEAFTHWLPLPAAPQPTQE